MKAVLFDMDGILIDTEQYLTVYKQKAMSLLPAGCAIFLFR